ncbi:proto-oncogene Mas-like [Bombina bombina]|uniref:proto-oncogene Mas-like n=1 Tax=Bombina bombina TaxID=8345 RepID=UPI00235AD616|nr:proto-oncogene Mas-like [Bombina bombina]
MSNQSFNTSDAVPLLSDFVLAGLSLFVSFFGITGNSIVLWILVFQLPKNKYSVYIINLSAADLLFLLFCLPVMILTFLEMAISGLYFRTVEEVLSSFSIFGYNTGLYLLTAISSERCLSVIFPLWYQCKRPKRLSEIVCVLIWMLSFLVTCGEFFMSMDTNHDHSGETSSYEDTMFAIVILLSFVLFAPVMIISNITLLIKIYQNSLKPQAAGLYLTISGIICLFVFLALPLRVVTILDYRHIFSPDSLIFLTVFFSSLNCSLNPFVYLFVGGRGKKSLGCKQRLQRIFGEGASGLNSSQPDTETQPESQTAASCLQVNSIKSKS